MNDAVEDGIREGLRADTVMPGFDGQLAGDHGHTAAVTVFDDFHQVAALSWGADRHLQTATARRQT